MIFGNSVRPIGMPSADSQARWISGQLARKVVQVNLAQAGSLLKSVREYARDKSVTLAQAREAVDTQEEYQSAYSLLRKWDTLTDKELEKYPADSRAACRQAKQVAGKILAEVGAIKPGSAGGRGRQRKGPDIGDLSEFAFAAPTKTAK